MTVIHIPIWNQALGCAQHVGHALPGVAEGEHLAAQAEQVRCGHRGGCSYRCGVEGCPSAGEHVTARVDRDGGARARHGHGDRGREIVAAGSVDVPRRSGREPIGMPAPADASPARRELRVALGEEAMVLRAQRGRGAGRDPEKGPT